MSNIGDRIKRALNELLGTDELLIRPTTGPTYKVTLNDIKNYSQGANEAKTLAQKFRVDSSNVDYYVQITLAGGLKHSQYDADSGYPVVPKILKLIMT